MLEPVPPQNGTSAAEGDHHPLALAGSALSNESQSESTQCA